MTVALLAIVVGGLLVYAALTGKSMIRLLQGDNQTAAANRPLPTE